MKWKFKRSHKYQQNKQPPLISNSLHIKQTTAYTNRNPGPGLEQAEKCGRAKTLNGIPTLLTSSAVFKFKQVENQI